MATVVICEERHMARQLAHVRGVERLKDVDAILHDLAFSMAEVAYDGDRRTVTLAFRKSPTTHDAFRRRSSRGEARGEGGRYVMEISNVSSIEVRDPAGLVDHTYSRLDASERGRLTLRSNFPGSVEMTVAEVDVRITA